MVKRCSRIPVILVDKERLCRLSGASKQKLTDILISLGIHIESEQDDKLKLEYDPNRPDYSTDYGIARAMRGKLGIQLGLPKHVVRSSGWKVNVSNKVKIVRPFVVGLVARGVKLDEEDIRQLIGMQEDLHEGMGRKRKKLAIGFHDAKYVRPPINYTAVKADFKFVPLNSSKRMTVAQILQNTEQGKKYSSLVGKQGLYPMLIDDGGTVLSMPPIINGAATVVTTSSTELFVDITGHDAAVMENALAIISETLFDMGASVQSVEIVDNEIVKITPDITPRKSSIAMNDVSNLLGVRLTPKEIRESLRKTRFEVVVKGNKVIVSIPRYRVDILHPVDIVEEVGYGFGYDKLTPDTKFPYSKGGLSAESTLTDAFRRIAIGFGFQEIITFSLKSSDTQYKNVGRTEVNSLKVESSKTKLYEYLRDSLTPGILDVLSNNVHEPYPQKLFEIGVCFKRDLKSETGVAEELKIAGAIAADEAPFSDIKSVVDAIIHRTCASAPVYSRASLPYFLEGRVAKVSVNGKEVGYLGEITPSVLRAFKIKMPVSSFELSIMPLI